MGPATAPARVLFPAGPLARYTDRTVTPGVRYTYVVIAVDNRVPVPNRSEQSIPVEELAR